jgi:energy-coupling factor transport system ATP-binding protein
MRNLKHLFKKDLSPKVSSLTLAEDDVIKLENVSYTYDLNQPGEFQALKNFSFEFKRNKIYCIIGNSGSGKSTLVQQLNGLLLPTTGYIQINDIFISFKKRKIKKIRELRKQVGLVFQFPEYQLFKDTIRKDISFGPIALGLDRITKKS